MSKFLKPSQRLSQPANQAWNAWRSPSLARGQLQKLPPNWHPWHADHCSWLPLPHWMPWTWSIPTQWHSLECTKSAWTGSCTLPMWALESPGRTLGTPDGFLRGYYTEIPGRPGIRHSSLVHMQQMLISSWYHLIFRTSSGSFPAKEFYLYASSISLEPVSTTSSLHTQFPGVASHLTTHFTPFLQVVAHWGVAPWHLFGLCPTRTHGPTTCHQKLATEV